MLFVAWGTNFWNSGRGPFWHTVCLVAGCQIVAWRGAFQAKTIKRDHRLWPAKESGPFGILMEGTFHFGGAICSLTIITQTCFLTILIVKTRTSERLLCTKLNEPSRHTTTSTQCTGAVESRTQFKASTLSIVADNDRQIPKNGLALFASGPLVLRYTWSRRWFFRFSRPSRTESWSNYKCFCRDGMQRNGSRNQEFFSHDSTSCLGGSSVNEWRRHDCRVGNACSQTMAESPRPGPESALECLIKQH